MTIFVLNTQKGTSATTASEAAQAIALDAGVPAVLYVRCETALAAIDAGAALWQVTGSGSPTPTPRVEIQSGGTTSKIAVEIAIPALLAGSYEITAFVLVESGSLAGIYSVRLALTVTGAGTGPTASDVPAIVTAYPALITNGIYTAAFPAVAGFPLFFQLAASHNPTAWTASQIPAGLTIANDGSVSGSVASAGNYQLTVFATNAAGDSAAVTFPILVTDPVAGQLAGGSTAAVAVTWALPPELLDLQFDLRKRIVLSARLAACAQALKMGDSLRFAVLPSIAGAAIAGLITSVRLKITPRDRPFDPPIIDETRIGTPLAPAAVGGHSYWLVAFALAGANLSSALSDINAAADAAGATEPEKLAVRQLACDAELRITYDGNIYTAATFPLAVLQSLIDAPA